MFIFCLFIVVVVCLVMVFVGCSSGFIFKGDDVKSLFEVILINCGNKVMYFKVVQCFYVNDGNIIVMVFSVGVVKQIVVVSLLGDDKMIFVVKYGLYVIDNLYEVVKGYLMLELIIVNKFDVVVVGWNYGFFEEGNLILDKFYEWGIDSYLFSEFC